MQTVYTLYQSSRLTSPEKTLQSLKDPKQALRIEGRDFHWLLYYLEALLPPSLQHILAAHITTPSCFLIGSINTILKPVGLSLYFKQGAQVVNSSHECLRVN